MPLTSLEQALALLAQRGAMPPPTSDTPRIGPWPTQLQADLRRAPGIEDLPSWLQPVARLFGAPDKLDTAQAQYPTPPTPPSPAAETRRVQERRLGLEAQPNPAAAWALSLLDPRPADPDVSIGVVDPLSKLRPSPEALAQGAAGAAERATVGTALPSAIKTVTPDALAAGQAALARGAEASAAAKLSNAARSKLLQGYRASLTPEQQAALVDEITTAFPAYDKYQKPNLPVLPKTLMARAASLSPQAQAFIGTVTQGVDPQHTFNPGELHALAAGEPYAPTRVVRPPLRSTYNYANTREGAPLGVVTRADESKKLDDYMQLATQGIEGRLWYDKGGEAMLFHVGDDPQKARELAALHSITSPNTDFVVNSGFAVKGHNQQIAGDPVATGQYPAAMSQGIGKVYAGTSDILNNLKRGPFYDALSRRGGFGTVTTPIRPTNDIWQAEAWGYAHRDGTPMRKGFGPKQHAWMDRMTQAAVDRANAEALGGYTDWTLDRLQAAAWFGARKRASMQLGEKIPPYADFATGLERNYAQGSREALPSPSTGHLGAGTEYGIDAPGNEAWRNVLDQGVYDITHDPKGRDLISQALGLLTGRSVRGPGAYLGITSPGVQTQVSLGTHKLPVPGTKGEYTTLDPSSEQNLRAAESAYALNFGQGAAGGGRFFGRDFSPVAVRNALQITLGRVPTQAEFSQVLQLLAQAGVGGDIAEIFKPTGYVMKDIGGGTLRPNIEQAMRQAAQAVHGANVGIEPGRYAGIESHPAPGEPEGIILNDWSVPGQQYGQRYIPPMRPYSEQLDKVMPGIAQESLRFDRILHEATGGRLQAAPNLTEVRQVWANEGHAGLERLARKWGISAVLLATAAGLGGAQQSQQ